MIRRPPRSTLFPTRRSSDLYQAAYPPYAGSPAYPGYNGYYQPYPYAWQPPRPKRVGFHLAVCIITLVGSDRKSTRLNSSHLVISYAVFCLKKKRPPRASEPPSPPQPSRPPPTPPRASTCVPTRPSPCGSAR